MQLVLDTSEAEQALAILRKEASDQTVTARDWQALFDTVPYESLKAREAAMGVPFSDEEFKAFLRSPSALAHQEEWRLALDEMKRSDLSALGKTVLNWLPDGATIHARVFPVIKPKLNSFVWAKPGESRAIFLHVERQSQAQFENTVGHECHHIGLASLDARQRAIESDLPPNVKLALNWLTGFGEGAAMLAAAGSDRRHPHWEDDALVRARWDSDMMHFNADVATLNRFFLDLLDGKFKDEAAIRERAAPFWGVQGAWYTVGYEMSVLIDKHDGREAFKQCLLDPRQLLIRYNAIANAANAQGAALAIWSPDLLRRLSPTQTPITLPCSPGSAQ